MPKHTGEKPRIENGDLIIPCDGDPKYHHWLEGAMSIEEILDELDAPEEVREKYEACAKRRKKKKPTWSTGVWPVRDKGKGESEEDTESDD